MLEWDTLMKSHAHTVWITQWFQAFPLLLLLLLSFALFSTVRNTIWVGMPMNCMCLSQSQKRASCQSQSTPSSQQMTRKMVCTCTCKMSKTKYKLTQDLNYTASFSSGKYSLFLLFSIHHPFHPSYTPFPSYTPSPLHPPHPFHPFPSPPTCVSHTL